MGECAAVAMKKLYIMSLNTVRNDDVALKGTGLFILEKRKGAEWLQPLELQCYTAYELCKLDYIHCLMQVLP